MFLINQGAAYLFPRLIENIQMLNDSPKVADVFLEGGVLEETLAIIRKDALRYRAMRRVPHEIISRFRKFGVYRALVLKQFGGLEVSPAEFLELTETIAEADASCGWVASFGVSATYLAALPLTTLQKFYADGPDVVFAGAIFPPQKVQHTDGGFVVSGRWPYASGCTGASMIGVGIAVEGESSGLPRTAVMPASAVTIDETWNTLGLTATGSHDVVADKVFVPEEWTFTRGGKPVLESPLYAYPSLGFAAQVLSVVGLGCARRALSEVRAMGERRSITGAPALGDRPYVQLQVGQAEAELCAARALFYDVTQKVWARLLAGESATEADANAVRLAATHAAQTSFAVAHKCFAIGGITAVQSDHILGRCLQDCAVVAQHAFMAPGNYEVAGKVELGRGGRPGYP